jgi:hypothetical protein
MLDMYKARWCGAVGWHRTIEDLPWNINNRSNDICIDDDQQLAALLRGVHYRALSPSDAPPVYKSLG